VRRTILFITDDAALGGRVAQAIERHGFGLSCESNVTHAIRTSDEGAYCLVLVDAAADGVAFPQLVQDIRQRGPLPIIVVSADREPTDEVRLLESGADDCIGRPTGCDALIARVRAVLRRTQRSFDASPQRLQAGNIRLDPGARTVWVDADVIECTSIEYDILAYLAREAGQVVSREKLVLAVCGRPATPLDRALDVHISHLRRKLRHVGRRIVTVRGVGYMLATAAASEGDDFRVDAEAR
jgi:two-component system, OmpR family, response regulator CpxR